MTRILSAFNQLKRVGFAVLLLAAFVSAQAQWPVDDCVRRVFLLGYPKIVLTRRQNGASWRGRVMTGI